MADLEAIKTREQAATPGPWIATDLDESGFRYVGDEKEMHPAWWVSQAMQLGNGECASMLEADAQFIAHAREDIPVLLTQVEWWKAEVAHERKLRGQLARDRNALRLQVEQLAAACEDAIGFVCAFMGAELGSEFGNRKAAENAKACLKKLSDALVNAGKKGIRPEFFTEN